MKKIVYSLLVSAIVVGQLAVNVQAEEKPMNGGVFDIGYHAGDPAQNVSVASYNAREAESLPDKYDSRDKNYITSVKNQDGFGSCWAFSTVGTGETSAIVNQTGATKDTDLSEYQFAYSFYHRNNDPLNNTSGDENRLTTSDYLNAGGNAYYSAMALSQWMGLTDEAKAPYADADTSSTLDENLFYNSDSYIMKNAYFLPDVNDSNIDAIKRAIIKYGAVSASYYEDSSYLKVTDNKEYAYYDYDKNDINHGIVVVGYDDNYSRSNFSKDPGCDGAWIIKNSWGNTRENGYFHMSYKSPLSAIVCYDFAKRSDYKNNYFYDGNASIGTIRNNNQVYGANIFESKAAEGEELSAVSIGIGSVNTSYEVSVYTDLKDETNPTSGTKVSTATGSTEYEGIYTVDLDKSVSLSKGDKFSVVVKLTCNGANAILYTSGSTDASGLIQFIDKTEENQSFSSVNGSYWGDLGKDNPKSTARIKAITTQSSRKSIQAVTVSGIEDKNYTGQALTQAALVVKDGEQVLTNDTDYTVSYKDNVNAGTATIIIKGTGSYTGTVEKTFTINPISLEKYDVEVSPSTFTYSGKANEPTVTIKNKDVTLKKTDYSVSYQDNINVGTASLTIKGTGNYSGTINKTFSIEAAQLANCNVKLSADIFTYSGNENKPKVTVDDNGRLLTEDKDFAVTYQDNIHVGTAKVIIQGLNNYTGTLTKTFTISEKTIVPTPGNNTGNDSNQSSTNGSTSTQTPTVSVEQDKDSQVELSNKTKETIHSSTINYLKKYYSKEFAALPKGATIQTEVSLKALDTKDLTNEQKAKIVKALQKDANVLAYYDISILATGYDKDENVISGLNHIAITQMDKAIQISMTIPNELLKENRQFGIIRLHDNQATRLTSVTKENVITFNTDCFSVYALIAKNNSESVNKTNDKVNTNDSTSVVTPLIFMGISAMMIVGLLITRKKRV